MLGFASMVMAQQGAPQGGFQMPQNTATFKT